MAKDRYIVHASDSEPLIVLSKSEYDCLMDQSAKYASIMKTLEGKLELSVTGKLWIHTVALDEMIRVIDPEWVDYWEMQLKEKENNHDTTYHYRNPEPVVYD